MESIVHQLQAEATDSKVNIADLLRKGLIVAKKLKIKEMQTWIESELNGYRGAKVPEYRNVTGQVKAFNPYNGWLPIQFTDLPTIKSVNSAKVHQSVSEIQHLLTNKGDGGSMLISYSASVEQSIQQFIQRDYQVKLHVSPAAFAHILDCVRTVLLNWALKLEEDGIVGEGVSFSKSEVEAADKQSYNINFFLGDVTNSQIQQDVKNSKQERKDSEFRRK